MSEEKAHKRKRYRKHLRVGLWAMAKAVVVLIAVLLVSFAVSGASVKAPDWVRARIEQQLNSVVSDGHIGFQTITLKIADGLKPNVTMQDLVLRTPEGAEIARISGASASLSPVALIKGELLASDVQVSQASINLRRKFNGDFDLGFGLGVQGQTTKSGTLAEILDSIDRTFEIPALAAVGSVNVSELSLKFDDARAGRIFAITGGNLRLVQDAEKVGISLGFDLDYGADKPAGAALSFETRKGSLRAGFAATVKDVAARDLASQIPALAWLEVLDAPISGALRGEIGEDGLLGVLNGTLEIGTGALRPEGNARAIDFTSGRAYFSYDPVAQKIRFDELSVQTEAGTLVAEGKGYLREMTDGWPGAILGQFRILELSANPEGMFSSPVAFSGGAVDVRLRLDPFTLTIGQAVLEDGTHSYSVSGEISADEVGWHVALDAHTDEISTGRLIELWPTTLIPNTRKWIAANVNAGRMFNVNAALRLKPGVEPKTALGFEFAEAEVRFMKFLPPVQNGSGHASITDNVFTLVAEQGSVTAPEGGVMDAAGTVFQIPDINIKVPPAVIILKARGPVHAAMSLLNEPPFRIMTKAEQPVDLAVGQAEIEATISLPLVKNLLLEDVDYQVDAVLSDVQSNKIVAGRVFKAERLALIANPQEVTIAGAAYLGNVRVRGNWTQIQGSEHAGHSRLEGTVELSQKFVDEFGIGLPKGSVTGRGIGRIEIDLLRGQAPRFKLHSDLNRIGLRLSDLGWALPRNGKGRLEVSGQLGSPPRIDNLVIEGAGLKATGVVTLNPDGGLKLARFARVRLDGWLDAPIELIGRGLGATPSVKVTGGTIDIRKTTFGKGGGTGSGVGGEIVLALDRLIVSEGITLTGFSGKFGRRPGFNGRFTAQVNGKARINGIVGPGPDGSLFKITSKDAGAVFRAAGVMETARAGSMVLLLNPRKGVEGQYIGRLTGENIRIRGAPALADLLAGISVIGMLEQLNGNGIIFTEVLVNFRLTPTQVVITSGSAVGASLGVSMDGVYNLGPSTMDMRGVISPIYLINGIGQIFSRRGEGLFGFNYRMTGPASDPKVQVNPLSILTPGMFREIFRTAPPKVDK